MKDSAFIEEIQMASIALDQNGDCMGDNLSEQLVSTKCDDCGEAEASDPYDAADAFGEPDIVPRIGNEYQAEVLPYIGDCNCMSGSRNDTDTKVRSDSCQHFFVGLPIPLTWTSSLKHDDPETVSDFGCQDSNNITETGPYSNGEIEPKEGSKNLPPEEKMWKCNGEGRLLVPGLHSECWSDAEKASFLLGLYIFEKNFVQVRRFIETKEMGAILSFYHGTFYGSDEYRRWSKCRKTKSKKCVYGQRIFSGLRQRELLSRLLPRVSEEFKSAILEVSKTFGDEKMSLVDYVSSLKAMVGMNSFVEAVGIGTGKDLTGMALEPPKLNQAIPVRPEIPIGKACSFLTTTEIIKFLSGDYRLSKARSNDLFWEAVWPRLLARGWHSEQPKNQGYNAGSNHCLVFLVPGVKKFSRRKLVKGDHYFDSVTDVLTKVAKEPRLIELDDEEVDGNKKKDGHDWNGEKKLEEDENDLQTRLQHCYLQPRTPNRSMHAIKFTVVDTSLSDGKVRELKTLPSKISNLLISLNRIEDNDQGTLEDNTDESNTNLKMAKPVGKICPYIRKKAAPCKSKKCVNNDKKSRKVLKSSLSRKLKGGNVDYIPPINKCCQRLTANSHEEQGGSLIHSLPVPSLENGLSFCSAVQDFHQNSSSQVSSCRDKLSSTSSSKGSQSESIELIDVNLPQGSPDFENGILATDLRKEQDNVPIKPDNHCLAKSSDIEAIVNPRRHSTRNRPPTTRALEALANGYLTVNRRQKRRDTGSHEDLSSGPSKRARGEIGPNESSNSSMASQIGEAENGVSNSGNCNMSSNFQVLPDATEESVSGQ